MRRARGLCGLAFILALLLAASAPAFAGEGIGCDERTALRRPFFGDTHVHTTFSSDAWGQGTLAGPADAYRFAKGEPIGIQPPRFGCAAHSISPS
ncbi:MAG: DUF3604 domain-containing protein [Deltaproteobacteria bacterium]|nr:DUF3604 domain-containing protein [Deltaproteobacteria bacterium]